MNSTRDDFGGLWTLYLSIGVGVGVLVFALVGFAVLRYRARPGREPALRSEHFKVEIAAAALILAIAGFLVFNTFRTEAREDSVPDEAVEVDVTAFQWGWRFEYPGQGVTVVGSSNRQPTLAVPVGEPVRFALTSDDVIHAFWVPEERFKRDAIPGQTNEFVIDFQHLGREEGLCTEYCGLRHTNMRFEVAVLGAEGYERWLAARR